MAGGASWKGHGRREYGTRAAIATDPPVISSTHRQATGAPCCNTARRTPAARWTAVSALPAHIPSTWMSAPGGLESIAVGATHRVLMMAPVARPGVGDGDRVAEAHAAFVPSPGAAPRSSASSG